MSKLKSLDSYALFYEKIETASRPNGTDSQKEKQLNKDLGLNEDQVSKLSDDLRTPMKKSASTDPLRP